MALLELDFRSQCLGSHEELIVTLPDSPPQEGGYPVLWLFHGANQDHTEWLRQTSIERVANRYGLAVVMPCTSIGYGMDMVHGARYYSMISMEMPEVVHYMLPALARGRDRNFVAGASMGGYIAFKWALNEPGRFCRAGAFAGALDITEIIKDPRFSASPRSTFRNAFGTYEDIKDTNSDLIYRVGQLKAAGIEQPKLWSLCGRQDFGYQQVVGANRKLKEAGADVTEVYGEGAHGFDMWDNYVVPFLDWLEIPKGGQ
jgi:putative tributyrin esterase